MDMMTEIFPNLYIGAWPDQHLFGGIILNVLEAPPERECSLWVPVLTAESWETYAPGQLYGTVVDAYAHINQVKGRTFRANVGALQFCAELIQRCQSRQRRLLVHCGAGIERSPLTVAWWLVNRPGQSMSWDEAYNFLHSKRPIIMDRRDWVPILTRN